MPEVAPRPHAKVVSVVSNKGGVGKTTVATNLAIYLRALHEELPVGLVTLDDQSIVERMFRLAPAPAGAGNLKHGWSERSFERVLVLGQYGIQFVPPPPDTGPLKARAQDPRTLAHIFAATDFGGVWLIDTKSDLEELTQNALFASDLVILPVADQASFEEAGKALARMARDGGRPERGRVLLTLVDRRTRVDEARPRAAPRRRRGRGGLAALPDLALAQPARRGAELRHRHAALDPAPREGHRDPPRAARAGRGGGQAARPRRARDAQRAREGARSSGSRAQPGGRDPGRAATEPARREVSPPRRARSAVSGRLRAVRTARPAS
jgi:cellulose biosynthesis protein BcsQ